MNKSKILLLTLLTPHNTLIKVVLELESTNVIEGDWLKDPNEPRYKKSIYELLPDYIQSVGSLVAIDTDIYKYYKVSEKQSQETLEVEGFNEGIKHWVDKIHPKTDAAAESMVFIATGYFKGTRTAHLTHPKLPQDLQKCFWLLDEFPELKNDFPKIAEFSCEWEVILNNWDVLLEMFIKEEGDIRGEGQRAPCTLMLLEHLLKTANSKSNTRSSLQDKVKDWLLGPNTGLSSEAMAYVASGIKQHSSTYTRGSDYPMDPSDFNRCLLLVDKIPEIQDHFPKIAKISPEWAAIIVNWEVIKDSFVHEAGWDWSKNQQAPVTFNLMKDILKLDKY